MNVNENEIRGLPLEDLRERLSAVFAQAFSGQGALVIEAAAPMRARVRMPYHESHLRPGGTISGPAMFALADAGLYVTILATIGWVPLAVTTNMNINFMNKPEPRDLVAECRLMKLGKALAVGEIDIHSDGFEAIVAHATGTYSIPPRK